MTTTRVRDRSRRVLDQHFEQWRPVLSTVGTPSTGWVRAIRESLGMSADALAGRMGITKRAVQQIEEGEVRGSVTIATLRRAADAMGCDLVVALVPRASLEATLDHAARRVARAWLDETATTMALEAQDVAAIDAQETIDELLANPARIWRALLSDPAHRAH